MESPPNPKEHMMANVKYRILWRTQDSSELTKSPFVFTLSHAKRIISTARKLEIFAEEYLERPKNTRAIFEIVAEDDYQDYEVALSDKKRDLESIKIHLALIESQPEITKRLKEGD